MTEHLRFYQKKKRNKISSRNKVAVVTTTVKRKPTKIYILKYITRKMRNEENRSETIENCQRKRRCRGKKKEKN